MSYYIVFAGKGGTGKSTLAALTVRYLKEKFLQPILAVDADPNYCLPELLGIGEIETIAEIRDNALSKKPEGMSLDEWLEIEINRIFRESEGFDLIVMGRPEGKGCYCAVNNVLKRVISEIAGHYKYIVVDNEAGMEPISRGIIDRIDLFFVVATPAKSSIQAALRIKELIKEIGIAPKKKIVIINQATEKSEEIERDFEKVWYVNFDVNLKKLSERVDTIFSLPANSSIIDSFYKILEAEIE